MSVTAITAPDPATILDLVDPQAIVDQIRDSARCVLVASLAREGIAATPEQIERLARELGRNCAQTVCWLEVTR